MNKRRALALLLTVCMLMGLAACSKKTEGTDTGANTQTTTASSTTDTKQADTQQSDTKQAEAQTSSDSTAASDDAKPITVIKYGTHWLQGLDPHYVDEATGEYVMAENEREARLAAEQAILDEYGVVFDYIQFDGETTEVLMQSVFAGDPVCDIAVLWGGSEYTVLGQNVCKQLDDFAYIFQDDPDCAWMLYDKLFGHYYMMSDVLRYVQRWPLCYNLTLVEAVDSLKDANGKTIYPNTLFDEGKWTWSAFKDYLAKINAFYANDENIEAYNADYRFAGLSALYSAGGAIYGANGLGVNTPETKKAVAYIEDLFDAGLLTVSGTYDNGWEPWWMDSSGKFTDGHTVFADQPDWLIAWAASQASERGQSIGIVPWPRPDDMPLDSEDYRQVITLNDSLCVLKGVSDEKTELALKAWALFTKTFYCELAGVDTIAEVQEVYGAQKAADYGFDIYNEEIGDSILDSFLYIMDKLQTGKDYSELLGMRVKFEEPFGKSLFDIGPSYDVAIEENMNQFDQVIVDMENLLSKEGVNDTVAPNVSKIGDYAIVPAGTTMKDNIWLDFISAVDGLEGQLGLETFDPQFNSPETDSKVSQTFTEADLSVPGIYNRMFKAYFSDSSKNSGYCTVSVIVYDPNNKVAPTVVMKDRTIRIPKDTDLSLISWGDAIESAVDANGLDVADRLSADLSEIDATTVGNYNVPVTITDFAGNTTVVTVPAEVY